ncbi:Uncharacterised protein [Mycobacteroides abscessus subsp. abscessus]|nr:Uncharacterised protein [Mycobacteroides abscessus subsp. abscessus]
MSKVFSDSGFGEVKAWCTAVHAPEPTATSPAAVASSAGSNSGASTTQAKAQASGSINPRRCATSPRTEPNNARDDLAAPAEKKMQSPGFAPT